MAKKRNFLGTKYIAYCYQHPIPYIDPYNTETAARAAATAHNIANTGHNAQVIVASLSRCVPAKKKAKSKPKKPTT